MIDYMTEAFGEPTEKQKLFFKSKTRYVGYGGARGGGKSFAVRAKATLLAYEYPGIKMLIIRKTIKDLRRNYIRPLQIAFSQFPVEERPTFKEQELVFWFPNGSMLELGYCDIDSDADGYRGNEWDVLFLDEATELSEYQYGVLNSCVRGVNNYPKRTYVTCNPGGVGHGNIKRLFIDQEYKQAERAKDYTFIQAHVWDNTPLMMSDPGFIEAWKTYKRKNHTTKLTDKIVKELMYFSDYVRALENLPKQIREAHLYGDWNVFSGQFFTEFSEHIHVIDPFDIEPHWRKSVALDYGLDRLAVLWFAVDEHGQTYCYRNYEESNLIVSAAAQKVKELSSNEHISEYIAPPDLWNRRNDSGKSAAAIFSENGVPLIMAGNDRGSGWISVKEYLKPYEQGGKKTAKMLFFNTCTWIIKFLPLLQFDIKKVNDVMTEPHDITHSPDALRYWCSGWRLGAEVKTPEPTYNFLSEKPKVEGYEVSEDYLFGGY